MSLEQRSKKELVEIIQQMKDKVKELSQVEKQQAAQLDDLNAPAIGLHKDEQGRYHLVHIKFDVEKNAAGIERLENLNNTTDPAIALWNLNKIVTETIMRKARGGKYDK
jgi:hypothetical protein